MFRQCLLRTLALALCMFSTTGSLVDAQEADREEPALPEPAPPEQVDKSGWPGPVEAEIKLRFGSEGNTALTGASVASAEGDGAAKADPAEIEFEVVAAGKRAAYGAQAMLTFPGGAGMALGPCQYIEFDLFAVSERPTPLLLQFEENVGDKKLGALLVLQKVKLGEWQTLSINLLRNELRSDPRRERRILPDGTPLTRLGFKLDPRCRSGLESVRMRNVRIYRQDILANAPVAAADRAGQTALHRAAMVGDAKRAASLLDRGAAVNAKNAYQYTPLAHAVIAHSAETVAVLIKHGADVSVQRVRGFTPLYDAAAEGQVEIIRLLMAAGADPTQQTEYKFEPLYTAVHHGHIAASVLLCNDPRVDVNRPIAGFHPLHVAAQGDDAGPHAELYEKLIQLGANVDLCSAAAAGDVVRMKKILEQDPGAAKTATILGGWTPLHDAVRNVRVEAVKLLLAHGADPNAVSGQIDYLSSPLHWVGSNILRDDPQIKLATLQLMVDAGAELNPRDRYGATPLDRARQFRSRQLTKALRDLGALTGRQVKAAQESAQEPQEKATEGNQ
ncbi:MAG: ankyrin repeat domain-containing protein [Planctomycetota bacterium]